MSVKKELLGGLTAKQEIFCQAYVASRCNGVAAAREAFDIKDNSMNTAGVMANEYLNKPKVKERVRMLLEMSGLNDEAVDSELKYLLTLNEDKNAKRGAIEIYNKMQGRYEKDNKQKGIDPELLKFYASK